MLAEVGVDKYYKLVDTVADFMIVGGRMMRVLADNVKEVPAVRRRIAILQELHEAGGHVGVTKLYQMARSLYHWPKVIDDCVTLVAGCIHCQKLKAKPQRLPLKPTFKFERPF